MISEISIIDNESVGVIAVRHCGDIFVEFNYCRNGEELQYPTKERAIEMATIIARQAVKEGLSLEEWIERIIAERLEKCKF